MLIWEHGNSSDECLESYKGGQIHHEQALPICVIMGENASFTNFGNVVMLNVRGKCTQGIVYTLAYGDSSFAGYPNVMQTLPRGWCRHHVIFVKVGRFVRWCSDRPERSLLVEFWFECVVALPLLWFVLLSK